MRLLLADALSQLAPEVLPSDTATKKAWINAVASRFFSTGKWAGTTTRWRGTDTAVNFAVFEDAYEGRYFTLPRNLLSILAAGAGNPAGSLQARFSTQPIRGPWHEFGNAGWGIGDAVAGSGFQDAGDGFTTFRDFSEASYLRVKTETTEADPTVVLFRGLDQNGEEIYTGSAGSRYQGVELDIGDGATTTTTQQFSAPPTLIKKPVCRGVIRLYAVNVSTAVETLIGIYDAGDTAPGFRRYRIACTSDATTVHAMCKRRFITAVSDADEVIPGNLAAIELGLHGRRYDLASDPKTADQYWLDAFGLLNAELGEYNGGAVPRFLAESGMSLGRIPRIN